MVVVNEAHFSEIEKTLLYISEARQRVQRTAHALAMDEADPHLIEALEEADQELEASYRRLMQNTYFAVPEEQLTL